MVYCSVKVDPSSPKKLLFFIIISLLFYSISFLV
eukprot:UN29645